MTAPDFPAALTFLTALDKDASSFCFRVFDDDEDRKDKSRARKFNGDLTKLAYELGKANEQGCGVFAVVNDGGQDAASIVRVRSVFADLDGAPLDPVLTCGLEANLIVESSPGKYHAYWLVNGLSLEQFSGVQRAIAAEFQSDPSVIDLPRVMRLPGFFHKKGEPFQSRIIYQSGKEPYSASAILERWPADKIPETHAPATTLAKVVEINRHASVLKETMFLAHDVRQGHMTREEALDVMRSRVASGRFSRHVPDDEIVRALDGALNKIPDQSGFEVKAIPANELEETLSRALVPFSSEELSAAADPHPHAFMSQDGKHGLFPVGEVTVIGAPGREGKTSAVMCIATNYCLGLPLAGMAPTEVKSCLIYSAEDDRAQYARKAAAQHSGLSTHNAERFRKNLIVPELHGPELAAWREIVRLEARQPVRGAIVEPLIASILSTRDSECPIGLVVFETASTLSDAEEDNPGHKAMIGALKHLAKTCNVAVVLVHHTSQAAANNLPDMNISEADIRGGTTLVNNARQTHLLVNLASSYDPFPEGDARALLRQLIAPGEMERVTALICLSSSKCAEPTPLFFRWEDANPYGPRLIAIDPPKNVAGKTWRALRGMLAGARADARADKKAEQGAANMRLAVQAVMDICESGQQATAAKVSAKCGRSPTWAKPYLTAAVESGDLLRLTEQVPKTKGFTDVYRIPNGRLPEHLLSDSTVNSTTVKAMPWTRDKTGE